MLNKDYREMLQYLFESNSEFLVVGAYAMAAYGYPRATGDLDLWIAANQDNAVKVYRALAQFGASLEQINEQTFSENNVVFQIGLAPRRIDILTSIDGLTFDEAYSSKTTIDMDGIAVPVIAKKDLIRNKYATGRDKDRLDADQLKGK
ncbi:MAG: nucleotidyltransferase [Sedimentisphaerales bacterium]|nr:nucleotidyltransferase [Sedimentisphaerales bacterium]